MAPATHTAADEDSFMRDLLSGIDSSFFDAVPSPDPTPVKAKSTNPILPSSPRVTRPELITPTRPRVVKKCIASPLAKRQPSPKLGVSYTAGDVDIENAAEGWDWDAANAPQSPASVFTPDPCTRCIVLVVSEIRVNGFIEKTDATREPRLIILRDGWAQTNVLPGDIINAIGHFEIPPTDASSSSTPPPPSIIITTQHNLLILHPDVLITPTSLASAPHCTRKPLLSQLLRSSPSSPQTPALLYGNVLHEVIQACLRTGKWDQSYIETLVDEQLNNSLGGLLRINVNVDEAKQAILERGKGIAGFGKRYMGAIPKPNALLSNISAERGQEEVLAITGLNDVEEDIWAPKYGLKGKLDASVQAMISPAPSSSSRRLPTLQPASTPSVPAPLELKTGRPSPLEHRAQTMLYTLLLSDRYGAPVPAGLLFYTQTEEVALVPAARNELRGLVIMRNDVAGWLSKRARQEEAKKADLEDGHEAFLPKTIDDERLCTRCYAVDACMLYRKTVEDVTDTTSPIAELYDAKTAHLTTSQSAFFKKWEALIAHEEVDMQRFRKELWTVGAKEREARGRCFADMVLDPNFSKEDAAASNEGGSKIHQHTYRFHRRAVTEDGSSLLSGHMGVGDAVAISVEPDLLALARGFVVGLSPNDVTVGVDHALDLDIIRERLRNRPSYRERCEIVFRVDRDELASGMARVRDNLAALFYAGGDSKRLRLVVDRAPPVFMAPLAKPMSSPHFAKLNSSQLAAVDKVLRAEDYALILGMPGTGKTTVVAALIKVLVDLGKKVLLSAYTHSAVDTILAKLDGADFGILRVGNVDKVHPEARKYTLSARRKPRSVEELERQLMTPPVVATTALSVRARRARDGGFDVSLFQMLSEAHPSAVVNLDLQYRMNEDIMSLSNKIIYSDRLRCGTPDVARQSLVLPTRAYLQKVHTSCGGAKECWLERIMDESCKVVFVDTDKVPAHDSRVGDLVQNEIEGELVRQIVETMVHCGVREEQLGVITVYRQQIKLLSHVLEHWKGIEILTADRSQGRDKDCIIVSMVRSNVSGQIGNLVRDWRRMNVAFTRARSKLIIIGSRSTLDQSPVLHSFFELSESRGWILRLPAGAQAMHCILASQTAESPSQKRARTCTLKENAERDEAARAVKKVKGSVPANGQLSLLKDMCNEMDF
ncbi:AAA domain-containing protein [Amylostereum chailletii]|nr:AAA domain-containing protein [Amylostereum chailletii]